jgi:hypothetical protein
MRAGKLILPLALLIASGTVLAESGEQGKTMSFDKLDSDGNGTVSRDEAGARPGLEASFDQLDANADGVLTSDEIGVGGPETERQEDDAGY